MSRFTASAADASDSIACTGPCCGVSRRGFLAAFAAAGAATTLPAPALAQSSGKRRVIDVHHHYFPDVFKASSAREAPLPPFVQNWSSARMIEEMDKNGVDKSVLSLASVPVGWFKMPNDELRPLIRACNDFAAKLRADNKGRHGLFAYVSCKDVDGTLREIEYAYDTLKADGIEMSTSFGDKWPGDPAFTPVFEELNRRKAIIYFHPLAPFCCGNLVAGVPDSWIEYPYDTGRAILSLLFNGALAKYRDIKWIFSHSGGALPYLSHRVFWQSRPTKDLKQIAPDGVLEEFKKLYYETANASSAPAIAGLLKLAPVSQVMFGSDFPYVTSEYNLANLRANGLSDADVAAIEYGNAERLIPGLKG